MPEPLYSEFFSPLSPDIEYRHKYAKNAQNPELNRALKRQKKKNRKSEIEFYNRDHIEINRICSSLQLSRKVRNEALNIRKQVGKIEDIKTKNYHVRCIACIKLACKIHDFPVSYRELIQLTNGNGTNGKITVKGNSFKKEIDKELLNLLRKLKLNIPRFPDSPHYIPYICDKLGLDIKAEMKILELYQHYKRFFKTQYSLKGYILALIYLRLRKDYKIRLTDLEEKSGVSRTTISARVRELERLWENIQESVKANVVK